MCGRLSIRSVEATKKQFALEWLRNPDEPFEAACKVFGEDTGSALRAASEWVKDPEVLEEQTRLKESGFKSFEKDDLRDSLTRKLMKIVDSGMAADAVKAAEAIAKMHGLIEKPGTVVNNNMAANRVMVVKDMGDDEVWAKRLKAQQDALKNAN